jgi:hypothetical protein
VRTPQWISVERPIAAPVPIPTSWGACDRAPAARISRPGLAMMEVKYFRSLRMAKSRIGKELEKSSRVKTAA